MVYDLFEIKAQDEYVWEENGKKFLALHGHQFDYIFVDSLFWGVVGHLYNFCKKFCKINLLLSSWNKHSNPYWQRMVKSVREGALSMAKEKGIDVVFCGHTHIAEYSKEKGICYYNSGSWIEGIDSFITIENANVKLYEEK